MIMRDLPVNARALIWCAVSTATQAQENRASMEEQERWAVNVCRDNNWQVIDILRVSGHSRNYKDIHTLANDARAKGIDAFDKLIAHLDRCDFDVFLCRDANRFARRASLLHYLIESIVEDCGAVIYSQHDGWVDKQNAAGFAAMKGYSTTQDMSWVSNGMRMGRKKRFEKGLPAGGVLSTSHKFVRDPQTGKAQDLTINNDMLFLYHCMGELVLEGVAWGKIGEELYRRWGLKSTTGVLYAHRSVYYRMYNPIIWGNIAMNHYRYPVGEWVFYPHSSKPLAVDIQYDVIPPLYTGEFARELRAELIRRIGFRGKVTPSDTYRFSNLCVCGVCGSNMSVASRPAPKRGYIRTQNDKLSRYRITDYGIVQWGLKCRNNVAFTLDGERICSNTPIYQITLEQYFTQIFEQVLSGRSLADLVQLDRVNSFDVPSVDINVEIRKIEGQMKTLITQQSLAPDNAQSFYQEQILQLSDQLRLLREMYNTSVQIDKHANGLDAERLKQVRLDAIWDLPDLEINRFLRQGFANHRVVVMGNSVVGIKKV